MPASRHHFAIDLQLLEPIPARDGRPVTLRMAGLADAELMFRWQSDGRTRQFARNPAAPTWDEHLAWVQGVLATPERRLCIVRHGEEPVGVLRLDPIVGDDGYEVSILTAPGSYRQGVGLAALRLARRWLKRATLHAEVLAGNEASRAMFTRAGYVESRRGHFINAAAPSPAGEGTP